MARRTSSRRDVISPRTRNVWGALLATLTLLGGTLSTLDSKAAPRADGVSLPALLAPASSAGVEVVLSTKAPIQKNRWQAIVIHHSASPYATPESLDQDARASGLVGLGDHFVIGNGNGMSDGELHVGARWLKQQPGAHTAGKQGDWYNKNAVGIRLVGNGERGRFSDAQMRRLVQLVDTLAKELDIAKDRIVLADDVAKGSGPGRFFPAASFREQLAGR